MVTFVHRKWHVNVLAKQLLLGIQEAGQGVMRLAHAPQALRIAYAQVIGSAIHQQLSVNR